MSNRGEHDIVIRGGTVVSRTRAEVADIAIDDGVITRVGGHPLARRVVEASDCLVMPGGIDTHVHLTPLPGSGSNERPDDFFSGSRAAVMGGITTIGNMTHQERGSDLLSGLTSARSDAEHDCLIDFMLHPVLNDPSPAALADIGMLRRNGYTTLKLFMVFEGFDRHLNEFVEAIGAAAANDVLVLMHCEERAIITFAQNRLLSESRSTVHDYASSRPPISELSAVDRAIALAEVTGAKIHIVHLSLAAALRRCVEARARGVGVYVETRPLYLHLTDEVFERIDAAAFVGNPPPRSPENREQLWRSLASGEIDTIASDHAPWALRQKLDSGSDLRNVLPGVAELETMLPMLFSEGVNQGRLSVNRFVEVTSANPARLYGLAGFKGDIQVGYDADLVVWDPSEHWQIDGSDMESRAGYTPYDGWTGRGAAVYTLSRGRILREPDGIVDAGMMRGRLATAERAGTRRSEP